MPFSTCPECEVRVFVKSEAEQGTLVTCDDCGAELEIVGLDPFELDPHWPTNPDEYGDGFNIFDQEDAV